MIEFDPEKDRQNIAKHGISLARASELESWAIHASGAARNRGLVFSGLSMGGGTA